MSILFYSALDLTILFLNTSGELTIQALFMNSALIKTLLDPHPRSSFGPTGSLKVMLMKRTSVRRATYNHGTPKLYRRPGHAGPRSKVGASWSGSAGKALRAHSAICASRAGRVTARELGAPKVRRGRKRSRKAYRWSILGTSERFRL